MHVRENNRLTLQTGKLYGWIMYPGYSNRPYRSPVRVEQIDAREQEAFELSFLNILYAAGVQRMSYLLRPIRWEKTYLIVEELQRGSTTDRVMIIEQLDVRWMEENVPSVTRKLRALFDDHGEPLEGEFLRLTLGAF